MMGRETGPFNPELKKLDGGPYAMRVVKEVRGCPSSL